MLNTKNKEKWANMIEVIKKREKQANMIKVTNNRDKMNKNYNINKRQVKKALN